MKLLTGNSNKPLSKNIAKYLKTKLVNSSIKKFSDGEIYIEINENIRGNSIFIIQSISSPANDNLMELLLCIDALKRSSAKNITAVIPYFGYARQDRKVVPRTSISAKLVSNLDRKSVVQGKSVDLGGRRIIKKLIKKDGENKKFFKKIQNKDFFNLKKYVHFQLKALNIKKIDIINKDTFTPKNNFFSARRSISRNENDYGRNISVIMINS